MANTNGNWDISTITSYIDENSFELISKAVLETNLAQYMNVRVGLQGNNVDIPLLDTDFVVQDGAYCGWNTTGDTTITQVRMDIANAKINTTQCAQALRDTFISQSLASGALRGGESLPFEALLSDHFVKKLNKYNEEYIVQGKTIGGTTYSGLTSHLTAAQGTVSAATATAWTDTTAVAAANVMYTALPDTSAMADDLVLILSPSNYRALMLDIVRNNYYHIPPGQDVFIPGTNVRAVASAGLVGDNKKYIGPASTLFLGTDLQSDFEQFKLWYSQDNDEMRALMRWRIGVAVSEPSLWAAEL